MLFARELEEPDVETQRILPLALVAEDALDERPHGPDEANAEHGPHHGSFQSDWIRHHHPHVRVTLQNQRHAFHRRRVRALAALSEPVREDIEVRVIDQDRPQPWYALDDEAIDVIEAWWPENDVIPSPYLELRTTGIDPARVKANAMSIA